MSKTIRVQNGRETPLYQMAADLSSVLAWGIAGWAESNLKSCMFPTRCPGETGTFCCHCMGNGEWDIWTGAGRCCPCTAYKEFTSSAIIVSQQLRLCIFGFLNVSGCSCTFCFVNTCTFHSLTSSGCTLFSSVILVFIWFYLTSLRLTYLCM